jgi:trehalose 6-phosphate synthase
MSAGGERDMMEQLVSNGGVWTEQRLASWFNACGFDEQIIVLANREPYRHEHDAEGRVVATRSASGVVNAVEPLIRTSSGVWVAHGSGAADRETARDRDGLEVPPSNPSYRLRRVWLAEEEEHRYYDGFANEGLWPLCHRAHVRPIFRLGDFDTYWTINGRFADAVCEEAISEAPFVLVQDYHFALAPLIIRERLPLSTIVTFWHIPWPQCQTFGICPWRRHLIEGLLGSSIVGFQTPSDCRNFIDTVERSLQVHIDRDENTVTYAGRRVLVRAYPASIEWPSPSARRATAIADCREEIWRQLALQSSMQLGVGVDRLDYTKGIEEKFLAVERLLECYPEFRERFVLLQLAEPSRQRLAAYREVRERVIDTARRVNQRFGHARYQPIVLLEGHHSPAAVYRCLRAADLCYVASLHDGMNLVSKEFVSARDDERGVLVLSAFTGAARELSGALVVNPYDLDEVAHVLAEALEMRDDQQAERMRQMRLHLARYNAYRWAGHILADAVRVRHERYDGLHPAVLSI